MKNDGSYSEEFLKSLNALTGISLRKIENYAKEHNPFNILEHPGVVEPTEKQLEKIGLLNDFIATYHVLKIKEEDEVIKFSCPSDSGAYFLSLLRGKKDREYFMVAFLGSGNRIIETKVVSKGTVNSALVNPRDILKIALANDAVGIILAHNHPGASLRASNEDHHITQRIVDIFKPLSIKVLDHIIVGGNGYSSMAEDGHLPDSIRNDADYSIIRLGNNAELDSELEL
jgi:DNA repair protein RadC